MTMDTLWDLYQSKIKNTLHFQPINLPYFQTIDDLMDFIQRPPSPHHDQSDLFYEKHRFLCEVLRGNYEAIERVAYELCHRQYQNSVYYTEVRFNPHLLCESFHSSSNAIAYGEFGDIVSTNDFRHDDIDKQLRTVIEAVISGLQRGCHQFGIKASPIMQCLRYRPDLSVKLVDLAFEYRSQRNNECHIVGMDLFGGNELQYHSRLHWWVFNRCKIYGLGRTVHCGDSFDSNGSGLNNTIHQLGPERIAYSIASRMPKHILHRLYKRQTHLELTPSSNLVQFPHIYEREDGEYDVRDFIGWITRNSANFSISTDFPILLDRNGEMTYLNELNRCMLQYNLSDWEIAQSVLNAARASFLSEHEKNELLMTLRERWKAVAPNVERHNFYEEFQDDTWDHRDLLNVDLLKSAHAQ